jgi:hypothetical protein
LVARAALLGKKSREGAETSQRPGRRGEHPSSETQAWQKGELPSNDLMTKEPVSASTVEWEKDDIEKEGFVKGDCVWGQHARKEGMEDT